MTVKSGKDHRARSQTFVQSPSPALPPKFPRKKYATSSTHIVHNFVGVLLPLLGEREGEEVSMGETGIQASRAEAPSLRPFPTAVGSSSAVSPLGSCSPAQPPQGLHGLMLPHAHRHALTPKLSSALKTPPRGLLQLLLFPQGVESTAEKAELLRAWYQRCHIHAVKACVMQRRPGQRPTAAWPGLSHRKVQHGEERAGPKEPSSNCLAEPAHTHSHTQTQKGLTGFPPISGSKPPLLSRTAYSSLRPTFSS